MNSHIDMLCSKLCDFTKQHVVEMSDKPSFSPDETMKLVRAVCLGKGIQVLFSKFEKKIKFKPKATSAPGSAEKAPGGSSFQGKAK